MEKRILFLIPSSPHPCILLPRSLLQEVVDSPCEKAVRSALDQRDKLRLLSKEWESKYLVPPVSVRIGLNWGSVLCGNIGSQQRMKYGLVGDNVNLTSR